MIRSHLQDRSPPYQAPVGSTADMFQRKAGHIGSGRVSRCRKGGWSNARWTGKEPMARIVGPTWSPTERFQPMKAGCSDFSVRQKTSLRQSTSRLRGRGDRDHALRRKEGPSDTALVRIATALERQVGGKGADSTSMGLDTCFAASTASTGTVSEGDSEGRWRALGGGGGGGVSGTSATPSRPMAATRRRTATRPGPGRRRARSIGE
jgi:hypothetical protein